MHNAPSVTYPVGRSALYGWILLVGWLLCAVLIGMWCAVSDSVSWRQILALLTLPLTGGFACLSWRNQVVGELRWTGLGWLWSDVQQHLTEGRVSIVLDWQQGMLLTFKPVSGAGWWCWMVKDAQPLRWHDLRRAVYSHVKMTSDQAPDALSSSMPNKP